MDWIEKLKKGDKVGITDHYGGKSIGVVAKITPTGKVRLTDKRLYSVTGREITSSYISSTIVEVTQDIIDGVNHDRLAHKLANWNATTWYRLTLDKLTRIEQIVYEKVSEPTDYTHWLWLKYQKTGNYDDLTRWLKHRAYKQIESGSILVHCGDETFQSADSGVKFERGY